MRSVGAIVAKRDRRQHYPGGRHSLRVGSVARPGRGPLVWSAAGGYNRKATQGPDHSARRPIAVRGAFAKLRYSVGE